MLVIAGVFVTQAENDDLRNLDIIVLLPKKEGATLRLAPDLIFQSPQPSTQQVSNSTISS